MSIVQCRVGRRRKQRLGVDMQVRPYGLLDRRPAIYQAGGPPLGFEETGLTLFGLRGRLGGTLRWQSKNGRRPHQFLDAWFLDERASREAPGRACEEIGSSGGPLSSDWSGLSLNQAFQGVCVMRCLRRHGTSLSVGPYGFPSLSSLHPGT